MQSGMLFGDYLRRYRELAGLTQEELAEKAGLTAKAIGALERGERQRPYPATVHALARALGLNEADYAALLAARHPRAPEASSPAPSHPASASIPATVPAQLTPLIGREAEIATVGQLLQRDGIRLLTLTGPGGVGKTRLALEVAAVYAGLFADGAAFIALASLVDADLVIPTIARALGLAEGSGQAPNDMLRSYLQDKHMLLVLDNCEHVLQAAPLISELLLVCPRLTTLATSRAPLQVRGEQEYAVGPLAVPDLDHVPSVAEVAGVAAVQLFVERAQQLVPTFQLAQDNAVAVAAICRRLDGLPLALELAAARVKVLTPTALLARLDQVLPLLTGGARDLPARQQTLRNAIDWSYKLLDEGDRTLFARLAVFVGGCTLPMAERVCNAANDLPLQVLDGLQSLLDKSLIYQALGVDGEQRFLMLQTISEYALERLEERGSFAALRRTHAEQYLALVQQAQPNFFDANQNQWFDRMETELDNLRAVLAWSKTAADGVVIGLQLAGLLWRFWAVRGHTTEGREWLDALLARRDAVPTSAIWYALHTAGNLADDQGDLAQAKVFWEECLAICRELGNKNFVGHMLNNLGELAVLQGAYDHAMALFEEALAMYREVPNPWGLGLATWNLGKVVHVRGAYDRARRLLEESLASMRVRGDLEAVARIMQDLGRIAYDMADDAVAVQHFDEAHRLFRDVRSKPGVAAVLANLGAVAHQQGDHQRAAVLLEQSLDLQREIGSKEGMAYALYYLGRVAFDLGHYLPARSRYCESLQIQQDIGDKHGIAALLEAFGALAFAEQQVFLSIYLLSAASALRQLIAAPLPLREQVWYGQLMMNLRASVDAATFSAVWLQGQQSPVEQAVALAQGRAPALLDTLAVQSG